ncbi:hypothetical protein EA462_04295 [Natrarchaeobius halalkaliphilus]|uniref:DUF7344 domain-containing protein n=1 Tax=Natrarchaeobius halalkaliphilus TaxID=1679091 RepID=A0A3N6LRX8_9EURY|nr:hypothetical protein [Natrarchaeobius halalkaliphilus]RQG91217.1 hypothetical protein EA462_04295 [Natrarchaeobius halalkaliphilus]
MRETKRESATLRAEMTPSLDLVFDLLSNRRRRYALYCLYDQPDDAATIEDVTETVVSLETRDTGPEPRSEIDEQKRQIRTELQHVHLPKLENAGVLEHDQRSGTVRYWTQPTLEEWLEHARHKELI